MEFVKQLLANSSIMEAVFSLVLLLVTTFVLPPLRNALKIRNDDKSRAYLDQAVRNALQAGFIAYRAGAVGPATILTDQAVQDSVIAFAKQYLEDKVPDALKHFGITDTGLVELINSRLPWEVRNYATAIKVARGTY